MDHSCNRVRFQGGGHSSGLMIVGGECPTPTPWRSPFSCTHLDGVQLQVYLQLCRREQPSPQDRWELVDKFSSSCPWQNKSGGPNRQLPKPLSGTGPQLPGAVTCLVLHLDWLPSLSLASHLPTSLSGITALLWSPKSWSLGQLLGTQPTTPVVRTAG